MIVIEGKRIIMNKGDYGLPIVFNVNEGFIQANDTAIVKVGDEVEKEYTFEKNENKLSFAFSLTEEETKKLTNDYYNYSVLAYREGEFLATLIDSEVFEQI